MAPKRQPLAQLDATTGARSKRLQQLKAAVDEILVGDYNVLYQPNGTVFLQPVGMVQCIAAADAEKRAAALQFLWRMRSMGWSRRSAEYLVPDMGYKVDQVVVRNLFRELSTPEAQGVEVVLDDGSKLVGAVVDLTKKVIQYAKCRDIPLPSSQQASTPPHPTPHPTPHPAPYSLAPKIERLHCLRCLHCLHCCPPYH
jgi:hypothetical protein